MRLKREFIVHEAGSETVLVPTGAAEWSGVVRGNRTLGAILSLLSKDATEDEIVAGMRRRFDAPEGLVERDVSRVISELRRIGALDE